MIVIPTVLILGAGASNSYGLPLGFELERQIYGMDRNTIAALPAPEGQLRKVDDAAAFVESFRYAGDTIDSFLGRRTEFQDIGKAAISAQLLPMENDARLATADRSDGSMLPEMRDDHWYRHLVDKMDAPWAELKNNNVSFVTFNYDRSLERFLEITWSHRYKKPLNDVRDMIASFKIIHVYGSLGSLDERAANHVPYGAFIHRRDPNSIRQFTMRAAAGIKVIPEARDESDEFRAARMLMSAASRVIFLGFAFDKTNVKRLGGSSAVGANTLLQASSFRRTNAERDHIASMFGRTDSRPDIPVGPRPTMDFVDQTSLMTLRHLYPLDA